MKTTKPKPFSASRDGILDAMLKKADQLARIDQIVNKELPKQAREQCTVGEFKDGKLCLIIENGGWSTALRYQQNNLIKKLRGYPEFHALSKITIKTRPSPEPLLAEKNSRTKQHPSTRSHTRTRATNEEIEKNSLQAQTLAVETGQFKQIRDPDLRKIMQELSKAIQPEK
ncbi:MAG: DUF721 domain-containing protein [Pseudomonadales bacterium]|nr:DUF721 domain-containing protein [Pseudomonadales bacterium]